MNLAGCHADEALGQVEFCGVAERIQSGVNVRGAGDQGVASQRAGDSPAQPMTAGA